MGRRNFIVTILPPYNIFIFLRSDRSDRLVCNMIVNLCINCLTDFFLFTCYHWQKRTAGKPVRFFHIQNIAQCRKYVYLRQQSVTDTMYPRHTRITKDKRYTCSIIVQIAFHHRKWQSVICGKEYQCILIFPGFF